MISKILSWTKSKLKERTSWDGIALVGTGVVMIMMPIDLVAYAAIAWGLWTIWKSEQYTMLEIIQQMASDRLWIYTALAGSLFGAIFVAYVSTTKLGLWTYAKIDKMLDVLIDRLGWTWLEQPKDSWKQKLPKGLIKKIDDIDNRLKYLEK